MNILMTTNANRLNPLIKRKELKNASDFLFCPGSLYKDNNDCETPEIQKKDKALAMKIRDSYIPISEVDK